jgi:hypothetical protein
MNSPGAFSFGMNTLQESKLVFNALAWKSKAKAFVLNTLRLKVYQVGTGKEN